MIEQFHRVVILLHHRLELSPLILIYYLFRMNCGVWSVGLTGLLGRRLGPPKVPYQAKDSRQVKQHRRSRGNHDVLLLAPGHALGTHICRQQLTRPGRNDRGRLGHHRGWPAKAGGHPQGLQFFCAGSCFLVPHPDEAMPWRGINHPLHLELHESKADLPARVLAKLVGSQRLKLQGLAFFGKGKDPAAKFPPDHHSINRQRQTAG